MWIFELAGMILIAASFYFTLTFFHYLKSKDERTIRQSKLAAVICLALSLFAFAM